MNNSHGKIIIHPNTNVWEHELKTAYALSDAGYTVEFIRKSNKDRATSADVMINKIKWEIKSPTSNNIHSLDRNVRRALHQSNNIIVDSFRIKSVPDEAVKRELFKLASELKSIKSMLFVNRHREVIVIK